jgi:2'-5' RNA ligase
MSRTGIAVEFSKKIAKYECELFKRQRSLGDKKIEVTELTNSHITRRG